MEKKNEAGSRVSERCRWNVSERCCTCCLIPFMLPVMSAVLLSRWWLTLLKWRLGLNDYARACGLLWKRWIKWLQAVFPPRKFCTEQMFVLLRTKRMQLRNHADTTSEAFPALKYTVHVSRIQFRTLEVLRVNTGCKINMLLLCVESNRLHDLLRCDSTATETNACMW